MEDLDFYKQTTMPHIPIVSEKAHEMPKKIGPYKIDSTLHRSSMSHIYLASHPKQTHPVVIKILSPSLITHQEMIAQFLEEAKIISLADHKNIVKLYDQGKWDQGLYIAMEFVQGISLRQFLSGRSLSIKRILDILLQVSYALLHLHTHGVIHRDLKPENILITENGQVKVIDFGIAQLQDSPKFTPPTSLKGLIGTPSYMSPEQKKDPKNINFSSDIYSLGVIAYELIIGRPSFGQIHLSLIPKNLQPIIRKALEIDPTKRTQDIVDFISEISLYLKTNSLEKDQTEEDELKESLEILGKEHKKLLPLSLPAWKEVEIGLAKTQGLYLFGTYYDFFRFPDGSMAVLIAESSKGAVSSMTSLATFRAIFRTKIMDYTRPGPGEKRFVTSVFAKELNTIFFHEPHDVDEAICLIHFSPILNEFSFISSGLETLWHLSSRGGAPRKLTNNCPVLGSQENAEFFSTIDNWNPGDLIVCHSCFSQETMQTKGDLIDQKTLELMEKFRTSSPKPFAESLLHTLKSFHDENKSKIVLAISRIQ